ncbi:L,D-transpeptidase family protein [Pseudopedobacter beijingensis]|uniref:L,D-transpeptidase family protein n=1 Tax=Pseudopedobacter beijingensis TaxID=1207056 RepID=A0ABW4IBS6_9SPHI
MSILRTLLFAIFSMLFVLMSCKRYKHEEFGNDLAQEYKNKRYKNFDTTAYFEIFKVELKQQEQKIHHPKWLQEIYSSPDKGLTVLGTHLLNGGVDSLQKYLSQSVMHGFDPEYFHSSEIKTLLQTVKEAKFKDINEMYPVLSRLEILSADGLINYANFLRYGAVNAKSLYGRYFDKIDRPDLIRSQQALDQLDLIAFLEEIQPKSEDYLNFQKLLSHSELTAAQREKVYINMERLRWLTAAYPDKYVMVNIPEFKLKMVDEGRVTGEMKVCVGETENEGFARSGNNHETPILSGKIDRMQVNPVWNIPKSIAAKEILNKLKENPAYLEEHNMVAYNKAKQLVDAKTIDWDSDSISVNDFAFKQNPGLDNSLGRIKFIFDNPYAIYLHDTPAKGAFGQRNRAVSHGCVRVADPAGLVTFLVNDVKQTEKIKEEISGQDTNSRWVSLKQPIKVFLAYYTAKVEDGKLKEIQDVYGYDMRLLEKFSRVMAK